MKTNRREFISYSATAAAVGTGLTMTAGIAQADYLTPNETALHALANTPFASQAMPGIFTPIVDATGLENHNK